MNQLSHFLYPEAVSLSLSAIDKEAALEEMAISLRHDPRIINWQEFSQAILKSSAFAINIDEKRSIMVHHLRTNTVQDLTMAVGCSHHGIYYDKSNELVFLIFIVNIPHALNNEYLRVMGAIARLCQEPSFLNMLLASTTPEEFIKLLSQEKL
ncbi:MAG: PTS sugar transporter subunit IIA [Chthoniobacterales bacterium]|nr:PTS sugar transporter subunit IIA [Chthoniobacterales bacterium]